MQLFSKSKHAFVFKLILKPFRKRPLQKQAEMPKDYLQTIPIALYKRYLHHGLEMPDTKSEALRGSAFQTSLLILQMV
jgi:hypothetical protein